MNHIGGELQNCCFKAKMDSKRTLHILDAMGNEAHVSVTNSVDWLIPHVIACLGGGQPEAVLLYGTDGRVVDYNLRRQHFGNLVRETDAYIDSSYLSEMKRLYKRR